jgi:xanthine/CO dehydrogenase XdhC/CoxF family maturation factor
MTSPMPRRDVRLDTSLELLLDHSRDNPSPKVLATLVATTGSTYRKPGARMLIMGDGSYVGLISGGCLESDLKIHAEGVLNTQSPRAVEYDMRGPDDVLFGIGAGCEGAMRILLEPAGPDSLAIASLTAAERSSDRRRPGVSHCRPRLVGHSLGDVPHVLLASARHHRGGR